MSNDPDPFELLDARALGDRLGYASERLVQEHEARGRLFRVTLTGTAVREGYPAFQAWPGVSGKPLEVVLEALGQFTGASAYMFFCARTIDLGYLTPVEIIVGKAGEDAGELSEDALSILAMPTERRLDGVVAYARIFASESSGW